MHEWREFAGTAESVGDARRFAAEILARWGVNGDDAVLLVSELATNAVRHAGGPYRVDLWQRDDASLRVEVRDADPTPPTPADVVRDEDLGGRGLVLVTHLAHQWGYHLTGSGKAVWFEL